MTLNELTMRLSESLKQLQSTEEGSEKAIDHLNQAQKSFIATQLSAVREDLNNLFRMVDAINNRERGNGEEEARS